jgi:hypothetical protein
MRGSISFSVKAMVAFTLVHFSSTDSAGRTAKLEGNMEGHSLIQKVCLTFKHSPVEP